MDWITIATLFGLFSAGFFFGFGIGFPFGKQKMRREIEKEYFTHKLPPVLANARCRLEAKDILNAEVIE